MIIVNCIRTGEKDCEMEIVINGNVEVIMNELVSLLDTIGKQNPEVILKTLQHHYKHMEELKR